MLVKLFILCSLLGIYPFVIYPIVATILGRLYGKRVAYATDHQPRVTVVIAAFNEARHIEATVRNKLDQQYPAALLEVIVVSDGSTDETDTIVQQIAAQDPRVQLLQQVPRQGKTAALNLAMSKASGEIVVFSDANSLYAPDAISRLMAPFADPTVGYASGQMKYVNSDGSLVGDGCTAYMRYENALRRAETRLGSIVGVDGGIDAVRKSLYRPMRPDQLPDFVLPLSIVEQGYRVVFEPSALLQEDVLATGSSEYRMRVRVALRAFWALWDKRSLLNPISSGVFAWQLLSHKILRYLAFLPLTAAAVMNWLLLDAGLAFKLAACAQVAFLVMAVLGRLGIRSVAGIELPAYCQYFVLLNWASAVAFIRFLRGEKKILWQPREG